jgi:large subunit ribosomal protein L9
MKVLFLEDVPPAGKAGEVREVSPGYARNYLLPRKLAMVATSSAVKSAELLHQAYIRRKAKTEAELKELAGQLEGREIIIKTKVGSRGRLYGSITNADIAEHLQKEMGVVLDKRKIKLEKPIKVLGTHEVVVKLGKDIEARLKVTVEEEKAESERGEATSS